MRDHVRWGNREMALDVTGEEEGWVYREVFVARGWVPVVAGLEGVGESGADEGMSDSDSDSDSDFEDEDEDEDEDEISESESETESGTSRIWSVSTSGADADAYLTLEVSRGGDYLGTDVQMAESESGCEGEREKSEILSEGSDEEEEEGKDEKFGYQRFFLY
jgi:hypothetical protein